MKRLAIFASGAGTNAEKIIEKCGENVALIVCNNPKAGVIDIAKKNKIPFLTIDKKSLYQTEGLLSHLQKHRVDLIVLAGFLWMIPQYLLNHFPHKIINIHPALLPKFGGKGMYGMNVHSKVIESGERESGITIHYVNDKYDEGEIIFQAKCEILTGDTPEILAQKIHELEHRHYPEIVKKMVTAQ